MKSMRIHVNGSDPVTVSSDGLDHLQISISSDPKANDSIYLQVWGYEYDENSYFQHSWLERNIEIGDKVVLECLDSPSIDKPLESKNCGPTTASCSFCKKTKDEVVCLIEGKFGLAHICNECVDACVGVVNNFKSSKNT